MNTIQDLKNLIVLSLDVEPADISTLLSRDFLHNRSRSGIELLFLHLEREKRIYLKGRKYHSYKKAVLEAQQS